MSENASGDEYFEIGEPERPKPASFKAKIQSFLDSRYFVAVCLVLVAITAFVLGRLSKIEGMREPVRVYGAAGDNSPPTPLLLPDSAKAPPGEQERGAEFGNNLPSPLYIKEGTETDKNNTSGEVMGASTNSSELVVASKNGTKYHYPWCAGAKQIADKNKITFNSFAEARASGYTPASNCKGLK